ncbi:hypothetical protein GCM10023206_11950 [Acinetobacter puyangensis]|uniref:Antitoxin ParD1/3/4 n=1 Tax=Acinetobacter puyangensis TaxID=1096779 RepID=A0A240E9W3_9GAMM|nr:type II toxin-antitoxin system ParD family antitoxin [Acinetobacter puyangensis]SNX45494.1 antitoxin ParD1/3/4 [Acinetobacter puyangensis]
MTSITLNLPDELVEKVKQAGLLESYHVENMFKQALLAHEDQKLMAIRQALIDGEQSGEAKAFDVNAFKHKMIAKHG